MSEHKLKEQYLADQKKKLQDLAEMAWVAKENRYGNCIYYRQYSSFV